VYILLILDSHKIYLGTECLFLYKNKAPKHITKLILEI